LGSATARIQYQPLTRVGPAEEPVPVPVLVESVVLEVVLLLPVVIGREEVDIELRLVEDGTPVLVPGTHW
jgi:hypothetical protein